MATNRASLFQEAEDVLTRDPSETPALPTMDIQTLVHELRVYEFELEAQNDHLREAEHALSAARDRYAELFEFAPTGYLTMDRSGTIMDANAITATMFGSESKQFIEQHGFDEYVATEDLDEWHHFLQDVFERGGTQHCDLTLKRGSTSRWGAHVEGCALHADAGNGELCMLDLADITARQRAEQALSVSEARYRTIFESIQDVYIEVAFSGRVFEVSPSIKVFAGYTREEVLGHALDEFCVHTEERDSLLQRLRQTGSVNNYEVVLRSKSGADVICSFSAKVVADAAGKPVKFAGTLRDVTEIKQLEQERQTLELALRQAQKMETVGQLAGGLAHDFNNVLTCMMGCIDLCRDELPPVHPARQWLDDISDGADHSANLIRQLLAFARKQTMRPKVLDVNVIVTQMLTMLRRLLGEAIPIIWRPGESVWPIRADTSQIEQVLAHLCVNARDAIQDTGAVHIATSNTTFDDAYCSDHAGAKPGEYVVVEFRDNGCGMDPETLEHVFEPFFTKKGMENSTGMGLSSVFGIVKQHSGFLEVSSELGNGTTFRICLPREMTPKGPVSGASDVPHAISEGHGVVLLVDDDELICKSTKVILERIGYTVIVAQSAREALRLSDEFGSTIDLLLTDAVMPEMNGRDLAAALAKTRPDMKPVFMSGYTADDVLGEDIKNGDVAFLSKPFTRDALAQTLHAVGVRQVLPFANR